MNKSGFRLCGLAGLALLGCAGSDFRRDVVIEVVRGQAPRPDTLSLSWADGDGRFLFRDREIVVAPGTQDSLATVLIEIERGAAGSRIVVVRGLTGGRSTSQAARIIDAATAVGSRVVLELVAGLRPDADGDGLPDEVDPCPTSMDPAAGCPKPAGDAAVAPVDAPAQRDVAAPVDAASAPEGPAVLDQRPAIDLAPDVPAAAADARDGPDAPPDAAVEAAVEAPIDAPGEAGADVPSVLLWRSWEVATRPRPTQAIVTSVAGAVVAEVELYESSNNGGVDRAALFPAYHSAAHADPMYGVTAYWTTTNTAVNPYVGKSTVGRGADVGESNAPPPVGQAVVDLQLHPPDNDHLVVAAFVAPLPGVYSVGDLAVRKVTTDGGTATLKVLSPAKTVLVYLRATSRAWTLDGVSSRSLGALAAGDSIYFAVDRDGLAVGDATEIAWTITRTPP